MMMREPFGGSVMNLHRAYPEQTIDLNLGEEEIWPGISV